MAPKKSSLRNLPKKAVNKKRAESVKGGVKRDKLAVNHNQVVL